jgi:hypothetical protein
MIAPRTAEVSGIAADPTVGSVTSLPPRLLPPVDDDTREFWTAGKTGALRLPFCDFCARWNFPPTRRCQACGGTAEYRTLSGKGRVFTYTVNHHPYNPAVPVPYLIAIVELAEQDGLRFTTNVVNCPLEEVAVGMAVQVLFEEQGEVYVPIFEPDTGRATTAQIIEEDAR